MQHAPQLNAAQTDGWAKINEIKPQNMSMPPPHYAQDPYYDAPWLEAYQPGRMGFSQQQYQYHNDPARISSGLKVLQPMMQRPSLGIHQMQWFPVLLHVSSAK